MILDTNDTYICGDFKMNFLNEQEDEQELFSLGKSAGQWTILIQLIFKKKIIIAKYKPF